MRGIVLFFFIFSMVSCSQTGGRKRLFCDYMGEPYEDPGYINEYFDRVLYYEKSDTGNHKVTFDDKKFLVGIKLNKNILSGAYLRIAREQEGFYREIFYVYRLDLETDILIHSYVYYISVPDYDKNFNDDTSSNSFFSSVDIKDQPLLFGLVEKELPDGYTRVGWDKSKWQCHEVSFFKYISLNFIFFMRQLLSA